MGVVVRGQSSLSCFLERPINDPFAPFCIEDSFVQGCQPAVVLFGKGDEVGIRNEFVPWDRRGLFGRYVTGKESGGWHGGDAVEHLGHIGEICPVGGTHADPEEAQSCNRGGVEFGKVSQPFPASCVFRVGFPSVGEQEVDIQ